MLDFMRRQRTALKGVWVILIFIFSVTLITLYIPFDQLGNVSIGGDVASVGGESVTTREFQAAYKNYMDRMRGQGSGEEAIAAVEALQHPHRGQEEREDEEGEVVISAAAEVVVVDEDRRREEERRPGAPRDAGIGGAGHLDEPANRRGDARQRPEEEEELEMEKHHPAELLVVSRQIQAGNEE